MNPELGLQVAALVKNAAYLWVIGEVATAVQDSERALEDAKDDRAIAAAARQWQVCRKVLKVLQTVPQHFRDEMKTALES